ncbi:hypothetical protein Vafri_540 [Volvox africanus]|nr:hypothetical protein Vafri_540 [Volvox africanus]
MCVCVFGGLELPVPVPHRHVNCSAPGLRALAASASIVTIVRAVLVATRISRHTNFIPVCVGSGLLSCPWTHFTMCSQPRRLHRSHGLTLVTTSRSCDVRYDEVSDVVEQIAADGDGMAVSLQEAKEMYQALKRDGGASAAAGGTGLGTGPDGSSNIVTLSRDMPFKVVSSQQVAATGGVSPAWPVPPTYSGPSSSGMGHGQSPPLQQQQQSSQQQAAGGGSGSQATPVVRPRTSRTAAEVVAAKLTEAAQAATAAATSPLASAAESLYAGLASLPIGSALVGANNRAGNALVSPPLPSGGSGTTVASLLSVDSAAVAPATAGAASDGAAAPHGNAGRKATAASITALAADQFRQQNLKGMAGFGAGRGNAGGTAPGGAGGLLSPPSPAISVAGASATTASGASATGAAATLSSSSSSSSSLTFSSSSQSSCPSEWFVVDDSTTHTRIFVIQGSDTLDHWKLNLTFDPVQFEDPALGVKVHRGVYEAACVLYERFLPLVYEHLQSSPLPMFAFTGHSIGGSMATLLMLMYRHRGVLPPHTIATTYTFGAPAVFCQSHSHNHTAPVSYPSSTSNSWVSPSLWSLSSGSSASSISSVEESGRGGEGRGRKCAMQAENNPAEKNDFQQDLVVNTSVGFTPTLRLPLPSRLFSLSTFPSFFISSPHDAFCCEDPQFCSEHCLTRVYLTVFLFGSPDFLRLVIVM